MPFLPYRAGRYCRRPDHRVAWTLRAVERGEPYHRFLWPRHCYEAERYAYPAGHQRYPEERVARLGFTLNYAGSGDTIPVRRGRFIAPTADLSALRLTPDYFVHVHHSSTS